MNNSVKNINWKKEPVKNYGQMKNTKHILSIIYILLLFSASAQDEKKLSLSGYVSAMPSIIVQHPNNAVWGQGLVHNRFNFNWQIRKYWNMDVGIRNRFIVGSKMLIDPQSISNDAGWLDLSWNWKEWKYAVGNTAFDRLFFTFEKNKWKLEMGRQRINWGQNFVWNPNDIFNTYSFFDFDYPERPGSDAVHATYFHNSTSSSELAVSVNFDNKVTAAYLYHGNVKNIDYQILAGEQTQTDLVIGGALTTDVKGVNLRGEAAYFHPVKQFTDTGGIVAVSVGTDYIFSNSLMLQFEFLYNNVRKNLSDNGLLGLYAAPLSAKTLSICNWNAFGQLTYPLTPRLNGTLSAMYFIDIQSCYAGFTLTYSVIENLDFTFVSQYFFSSGNSPAGKINMLLGFARLKYSF
jgi:hypothetical protein